MMAQVEIMVFRDSEHRNIQYTSVNIAAKRIHEKFHDIL